MKSIYIHIPFCSSKCDYCAFYSFTPNDGQQDLYLEAVLKSIDSFSKTKFSDETIETVYFGGGTPSFFGAERIAIILDELKNKFNVSETAEITVECNPSSVNENFVKGISLAGVNRISMGVQSANDDERKALGRKSDCMHIEKAISLFKENGIENISLDLMLGIPNQTKNGLKKSIDFLNSTDAKHISAYILKNEDGTPLSKKIQSKIVTLPNDDETADLYLFAVNELKKLGFKQYEVSNFCKDRFESRHNSNYWLLGQYIGIGPSAHSFFNGKRFYFKSDFDAFVNGQNDVSSLIFDGEGGDEEEYIMLGLRLSKGVGDEEYFRKFGKHLPERFFKKASEFEKHGLLTCNEKEKTVALTADGFLISNSIIIELLDCI